MDRVSEKFGPSLGSLRLALASRARQFWGRMVSRGPLNVVIELYLLVFSFRLIILIVLNLYRNKLMKEHGKTDFSQMNDPKAKEIQDLLDYMSYYSSDFVSSGIYSCTMYLWINIVYRHISFFGIPMVQEGLVPLVRYLSNRDEENIRIKARIQDYLSEIILSNVNFTSHVIKIIIRDDLYKNQCDRCEHQLCKRKGSSLLVTEPNRVSSPKGTGNVLISPPIRDGEVLASSVSELSPDLPSDQLQVGQKLRNRQLKFELDEKLRLLSREYNYLTAMQLDDNCLWPNNRNQEWLNEACKLWLYIYTTTYTGFYVFILTAHMSLVQVHHHQRVIVMNDSYPFNWYRAWFVADLVICASLTLHSVTSCLSELTIGIIDQNKLMDIFRVNLRQFLNNVKELRLIRQSAAEVDLSNSNNDSLRLSLQEQQLRAQCETIAIQSYIQLRYFVDEIQPLLNCAGSITTIDVSIMVVVCLVTLIYHVEVKPGEFFVFVMLSLICVIKINVSLLNNAVFTSNWLRVAKLSWSLIHCALEEQEHIDSLDDAKWRKESSKKTKKTKNNPSIKPLPEGTVISGPSAKGLDPVAGSDDEKEIHRRPLMSAHILFLWRRLVSDSQKFSDRLTSSVLGFNSDYNLLISFNFWVISLIILYFTYRK